MDEQDYEKLLQIKTSGEQQIFNDSPHYNRYEATAYQLLDALSENYQFSSADSVVDFGCGKGRLPIYLHHRFSVAVTGIEMNAFFHKQSLANKESYLAKHKKRRKAPPLTFLHGLAEEYEIAPNDNIFYFFNPFSVQIFAKVIAKILSAPHQALKHRDLILYYPSADYIDFLENSSPFLFLQEIASPFLYENDPRNRFSIYRLTDF